MKKSIRTFRLNFVISYYPDVNINNFREPIHALFQDLAWLYGIEFSTSSEHPFVYDDDSSDPGSADLVYFRSTERTRIDAKTLRKVVLDIFRYSSLAVYGCVEVVSQIQKFLPAYPFPKDYLTPLNYPYVEVHKDGHTELCIVAKALNFD